MGCCTSDDAKEETKPLLDTEANETPKEAIKNDTNNTSDVTNKEQKESGIDTSNTAPPKDDNKQIQIVSTDDNTNTTTESNDTQTTTTTTTVATTVATTAITTVAVPEAEEWTAPKRVPKEDPGDGLPEIPPSYIEFTWNKEMQDKRSCDTLHLLYLLQLALNLVRLRTIERNKYFKSIGRTDRFISQLDNPGIINRFIKWHKSDPENNKFDGEMMETREKLFLINQVVSEIGNLLRILFLFFLWYYQ